MIPTPSAHQEDAVFAVKDWFKAAGNGAALSFYLGGYAGTGKSTLLPVIVDALNLSPEDVAFCAPTGKAAKIMSDKLRARGLSVWARTIHSLIYRPKGLRIDMLMADMMALEARKGQIAEELQISGSRPDLNEEMRRVEQTITILDHDIEKALSRESNESPIFQLNPESDIRKAKLCIVDEASMVGADISEDLVGFGIPLLAIGDPGQLPPVKDDPGLTAGQPDFFLTEIHRQALDNPIIALATMAREGRRLNAHDYGNGVRVIDRINDDVTYDPDFDGQIIVGTNRRRWMVTRKLRNELGINTTGPVEGEPLIICKNSRTKPLVNGSFVKSVVDFGDLVDGAVSFTLPVKDENGVVYELELFQGLFEETQKMEKGYTSGDKRRAYAARIKCEHADFGLAITCHKAQGSQWKRVVLHDESGSFRDDASRWLYTGITRAAEELTVVL